MQLSNSFGQEHCLACFRFQHSHCQIGATEGEGNGWRSATGAYIHGGHRDRRQVLTRDERLYQQTVERLIFRLREGERGQVDLLIPEVEKTVILLECGGERRRHMDISATGAPDQAVL